MAEPNGIADVEFGGPATYRILVQGEIGERWLNRLAGLEVSTVVREHGAARTTLAGSIRDQAELSGVLETLYGLHLPILRVEKVENET